MELKTLGKRGGEKKENPQSIEIKVGKTSVLKIDSDEDNTIKLSLSDENGDKVEIFATEFLAKGNDKIPDKVFANFQHKMNEINIHLVANKEKEKGMEVSFENDKEGIFKIFPENLLKSLSKGITSVFGVKEIMTIAKDSGNEISEEDAEKIIQENRETFSWQQNFGLSYYSLKVIRELKKQKQGVEKIGKKKGS